MRKLKLMELAGKGLILASIFIQVSVAAISNYDKAGYGSARVEALTQEMYHTALKVCAQVTERDHPAWYDCFKLRTVHLLEDVGVFDEEGALLSPQERAELNQRAWEVEMLNGQNTATWFLYLSGFFLLIGSGLVLWAEAARFTREQVPGASN